MAYLGAIGAIVPLTKIVNKCACCLFILSNQESSNVLNLLLVFLHPLEQFLDKSSSLAYRLLYLSRQHYYSTVPSGKGDTSYILLLLFISDSLIHFTGDNIAKQN